LLVLQDKRDFRHERTCPLASASRSTHSERLLAFGVRAGRDRRRAGCAPKKLEELTANGGWTPAGFGVFRERILLSEDGQT